MIDRQSLLVIMMKPQFNRLNKKCFQVITHIYNSILLMNSLVINNHKMVILSFTMMYMDKSTDEVKNNIKTKDDIIKNQYS
jgi:hypothetical protein